MQTNVWKFMGLAVFCVVLGDPTLKEVCFVFVGGKRQNNEGFYYSGRHRSDVSVHKTNNTFLPSHTILYGRDLVCT